MEAGTIMAFLGQIIYSKPLVAKKLKLYIPREFSLSVLHYTSDTPYNLRGRLLSRKLGLTDLEAAYA